jgi:hypothetical protein
MQCASQICIEGQETPALRLDGGRLFALLAPAIDGLIKEAAPLRTLPFMRANSAKGEKIPKLCARQHKNRHAFAILVAKRAFQLDSIFFISAKYGLISPLNGRDALP